MCVMCVEKHLASTGGSRPLPGVIAGTTASAAARCDIAWRLERSRGPAVAPAWRGAGRRRCGDTQGDVYTLHAPDPALPRPHDPRSAQGARQAAWPHCVGLGARSPRARVRVQRDRRAPHHVARHCRVMARSRGSRRHRRVRETAAPRYPAGTAWPELTGVVLDSDVIIEILRGRAGALRTAVALEKSSVPTFSTAISWAEIFAGVRPDEETATRAFFEARGEVALDGRIGRRAGDYLARYAKSDGVEIADALIAAAAAVSGLRLWTLNRRHYPMADVGFFEAR